MHELGHAIFGFNHNYLGINGNVPVPSIMGYDYVYIPNQNFSSMEQSIIKLSRWGN